MKYFSSTIVLWLAVVHLLAAELRLAIGRVATQAKLLTAEVSHAGSEALVRRR